MKTQPVLILIAGFLSAFSCRDTGTAPGDQKIPLRPLTAVEQAIVTADNSFGFKLFTTVNAVEPGKNFFLSPTSVSMALGMTLNGASGATRDTMAKVLEFAGLKQSDINASYKSLMTLLTGLDPKVQFQVANSIWYRPDLQVLQAFKDVNKEYFNAEISSIDFSSAGAADIINGWVDHNTNGKIKEIVPKPIPPEIVMYLINAIYFKGTWTYRFDPAYTRDTSFTLPSGARKTCKLMSMKATVKYGESDQCQIVDLPYGDAGFSMTVLLPKPGTAIDNFASTLTQAQWSQWMANLRSKEGDIYLPKFKLEYGKKLNDMLIAMGMGLAFLPGKAEFMNIDTRGGLYISEVQHKTFVQVDEEGTEAAGVTSVGVGRTSIGDNFTMRIDRPFVVMIRENGTGTILFIGKIVDPAF